MIGSKHGSDSGYETLSLAFDKGLLEIAFNRSQQRNSLNRRCLAELEHALDRAEHDPACKLVVLAGRDGVFCTGMDFREFAQAAQGHAPPGDSRAFSRLLRRLSLFPKVVVAKVDGEVTAGGVGIVAACDLVVASPASRFGLSEALWGLLPAMVMPYLIRRVGFQKAYALTLTTLPIGAEEAHRVHLVDELTKDPDDSVRRLSLRVRRIESSTVLAIKRYFRSIWIVNEGMEDAAVTETERLAADPQVQQRILAFVQHGRLPGESSP